MRADTQDVTIPDSWFVVLNWQLYLAKSAISTRFCTLFDTRILLTSRVKVSNYTCEVCQLHVWSLSTIHVNSPRSTCKVPFFATFRSVQYLTEWWETKQNAWQALAPKRVGTLLLDIVIDSLIDRKAEGHRPAVPFCIWYVKVDKSSGCYFTKTALPSLM